MSDHALEAHSRIQKMFCAPVSECMYARSDMSESRVTPRRLADLPTRPHLGGLVPDTFRQSGRRPPAGGTGRVYGVRPARCRPVFGGGTSDHALEAHSRIQKTFCSSIRAVAPVEWNRGKDTRCVRLTAKLVGLLQVRVSWRTCIPPCGAPWPSGH